MISGTTQGPELEVVSTKIGTFWFKLNEKETLDPGLRLYCFWSKIFTLVTYSVSI